MIVMLPVEILAKNVELNIIYDGRNISMESEDTDTNWTLNNLLPGQSDTSSVSIKNTGSYAVTFETGISIEEDNGLLEMIDLKVTNKAGNVVYEGSYTDLKTIETGLAPGATETFTVVTSLNRNAGNEYQGKQYKLKFNFTATGDELKGTLTVRYVDQDGNDIEPATIETNYVTEKFDYRNVEPKDFSNQGYSYTGRVDGELYGNYNVDGSEIVYYYVKNSSITVKHVVDDEFETDGTNKVLKEETEIKGVGSQYNYSAEIFPGYEFTGTIDGEATGTITDEPKEVVFHYKKVEDAETGRVIILYIDENGSVLLKKIDTKKVGCDYSYTERLIVKTFNGYKYIGYEGNLTGTFKKEDTIIYCKYKKAKEGRLIILCIDENNTIIRRTVTTEEVGTDYNIGEVGEEISGYEFLGVEGDTVGKYKEEDTIVTYRYRSIKKGPSTNKIVKPKTGDNIIKYIAIAAIAVAILLIIFLIKKKKDEDK